MNRRWLAWLGAWCLFDMASSAGAQAPGDEPEAERTVAVKVVEVAGGRAYLEPGAAEGIERGDSVILGRRIYEIAAVSAGSAVIESSELPRLGTTGKLRVRQVRTSAVERLPKPAPLEAYTAQWPRARPPALDQKPRPVPLGPVRGESRAQLWLSAGGAGVVPLSGPASVLGRGQLRGRLHYEPVASIPLAFDADVAGQLWLAGDLDGRAGSATRVPVFVRELSARYGHARDWNAAIGRLRYASETLGMLDGGRAEAPLGATGLSLAAFGGALPEPLDGMPSLDAQRFGGELTWQDDELDMRPRVVVGGHGSYFDGRIDERRISAVADLYPDFGQLGAHLELSFLDANNPWNAPTFQVSAAGVDSRIDVGGGFDVGGRFELRTPERSRWLASFLPAEWLCTPASGADVLGGGCVGDELYYGGTLDTRLRTGRVLLTVGGSADGTRSLDANQLGAFAHLRLLRLWRTLRMDGSVSYSNGSLSRGGRALVGLGGELARGAVDLSVYYQPAYLTYTADVGYYLEHGVGASVLLVPGNEWDVTLVTDLITGRDVDLLLVQAFVNYRPEL